MRKFESNNIWGKILSGITLLGLSGSAMASNFQLFEYNGAGVGNYDAGGAAIADDASTGFINPAGLVRLEHAQFVIAGSGIWTEGVFHGTACGGVRCVPANVSKDGGGFSFVPAFYYALPINDRFTAGIGANAPFGLSTNYGKNSLLSYSASFSQVQVMNINPTLAFKFNDQFSMGFGLDIQKMDATLNAEVNLAPQLFPNSQVKNTANDWKVGWNAGLLYQFNEATRAGLSYISRVKHHIKGDAKLTGGVINNIKSNHLEADITLPPTTVLSIYHDINETWSVMGTAIYTQWETIQQIALNNTTTPSGIGFGSTLGTVVLPENFTNTWRLAVGADYRINEKFRLRSGIGYDKSPVNNTDRVIRLPDNNRFAVAVGAQYAPTEVVRFDIGYQHLFIKDGEINQVTPLSKSIGHTTNSANLVGLQLTVDVV